MYTRKGERKHNGRRTVRKSPFSLPHTHTEAHKIKKKQKHICPKRFWQELRQTERNTGALRAHSQKSAVRKTHITGSPPLTKRGGECQEYARCIKPHRCYRSGSAGDPSKQSTGVISAEAAARESTQTNVMNGSQSLLAD